MHIFFWRHFNYCFKRQEACVHQRGGVCVALLLLIDTVTLDKKKSIHNGINNHSFTTAGSSTLCWPLLGQTRKENTILTSGRPPPPPLIFLGTDNVLKWCNFFCHCMIYKILRIMNCEWLHCIFFQTIVVWIVFSFAYINLYFCSNTTGTQHWCFWEFCLWSKWNCE